MTDGQMFEELIKIHAQSAGEAISSILRADIEIGGPRLQEMSIKDVEYGILEPAIFVKSCLTSPGGRQHCPGSSTEGYAGILK